MSDPTIFNSALTYISRQPASLSSRVESGTTIDNLRPILRTTPKGRVALVIMEQASLAGYPESSALALAAIASAESNLNPKAVNATTGALGLFQMIPRYWKTAKGSAVPADVRAQLLEFKKHYSSDIINDPATLYATNFYPGLGKAHLTFHTMGYQPGAKTFGGQYAYKDALGTVFHSPLLMMAYAAKKFEQSTGVDIDLRFPLVATTVTKTNVQGNSLLGTFELQPPFSISASSTFVVGSAANAASEFGLDRGFEPSAAPVFDIIDTPVVVRNPDLGITISDETIGLAETGRYNIGDTELQYYGALPDTLFYPSGESLIAAIRNEVVDMTIIEGLFSLLVRESHEIDPNTMDRITGQDTTLNRLEGVLRRPGTLVTALTSLADEKLFEVLYLMLQRYILNCSFTMFNYQLCHHRQLVVSGDYRAGANGLFSATVENPETYRYDARWLAYGGVLFPFSLLVTPAAGMSLNAGRLSFASFVPQKLRDWVSSFAEGAAERTTLELVASRFQLILSQTKS